MEYTANIMEQNNGLISSLLKVFAMFESRLNYKERNLDVVSLRCINCKIETGLFLNNNNYLKCNIAPCWYAMDNQLQQIN